MIASTGGGWKQAPFKLRSGHQVALTAVFHDAIVPHSEEASLCRLAYNRAHCSIALSEIRKCTGFFELTILKPIAPTRKELKP
jgi:hypothetical protein